MSSPISARGPAPTPSSTGSAASSSSSPDAAIPLARVGRDGRLDLEFARRGPRTILTARRFTLPLQALEPMDLDGSGAATLMLLNPTGGVLGGDVLDTRVGVGPGAHVVLTTPAATRVYRSRGAPAVQRTVAEVRDGARLEHVPDHVIPSPGARLRQSTEIALGRDAALILADAWALGRVARGERWSFHELDLALTVRDARGLLLRERAVLDGLARDGLGFAEGYAYVATFAAIAPDRDGWGALADRLLDETRASAPAAHVGVSPLGRGGVVARLLCPSAPVLDASLRALWGRARRHLFGLPPLRLRKL